MTLQQIVNEIANGAYGNFAAMFGISDEEGERIAAKCKTAEDFRQIWENENWWADDAQSQ